MKYHLDTNAVRRIVRQPGGKTAQRFRENAQLCAISAIVASEIEFGIARNPDFQSARNARSFLRVIEISSFGSQAAAAYGDLRAKLAVAGKGIGPNDSLIAAHALALDVTLVSDDRAFGHVPNLKLENWQRES